MRVCGEQPGCVWQTYRSGLKGSGRCPEVFCNGVKGPRQVVAVKPGKGSWGSVPSVKTPSCPQELPPLGSYCRFSHVLFWLQLSIQDLAGASLGPGQLNTRGRVLVAPEYA